MLTHLSADVRHEVGQEVIDTALAELQAEAPPPPTVVALSMKEPALTRYHLDEAAKRHGIVLLYMAHPDEARVLAPPGDQPSADQLTEGPPADIRAWLLATPEAETPWWRLTYSCAHCGIRWQQEKDLQTTAPCLCGRLISPEHAEDITDIPGSDSPQYSVFAAVMIRNGLPEVTLAASPEEIVQKSASVAYATCHKEEEERIYAPAQWEARRRRYIEEITFDLTSKRTYFGHGAALFITIANTD